MDHKMFTGAYKGAETFCIVCGGEGGSLTTDCPGAPLDISQEKNARSGWLDFQNGEWVTDGEELQGVEIVDPVFNCDGCGSAAGGSIYGDRPLCDTCAVKRGLKESNLQERGAQCHW